jgi:hypothetical protein
VLGGERAIIRFCSASRQNVVLLSRRRPLIGRSFVKHRLSSAEQRQPLLELPLTSPLEPFSDTSKLEANATMLNQYNPMFYSKVKLYSQRLMKLQNRVLAPGAMHLSRWPAEHLDQRSLSTNDFSSVSYPSVVLACFFLLVASLIVPHFLAFSHYLATLN